MSSASAVVSHAAALAAVAASSRADARARVASSVGAAPRSVSRAPRARAAVRARAASFSSGDAAPELVEGPRGEVYASTDEAFAYASRDGDAFDDAFEDVGASQSGSGGYGARRTTRKKKGRKSSGYAQGTRGGAASRAYEYGAAAAAVERGPGGAFGSRRNDLNSGSFSGSGSFNAARDERRRRTGDDHLFEFVPPEWREKDHLSGPTRALQRAADKGDADGALHALRRLRAFCDESNDCSLSGDTKSGALPLAFYNAALRACKRSRPPAHVEARRLLLEMRDDDATPGVAPDARTYHEVVAALARAHEWRLAERTFAEMRAAFPNHDPSVLVYTSLISAYGKGGQWDKANLAFESLRSAGTPVDTGVYNALLSAAVSAARYREAAKVFERMPSEGVRRNVTTYNAVLTSLGRQRRLRDMENLRREMRACGIEANETTFSVLITAHGNAGDCVRACALLDEACDTPWVYKSAVVFNSALGACVKAGESKLAKRVLRLMRAEGIHPTLVTYNTMLMGASAERDWGEVSTVFRDLLRSGHTPDAITLDCLCGIEKLQAAADARAEAEAAARRAMALGSAGEISGEDDGDAVDAVAEPSGHGSHASAVSTDLGDLCERLREVVAEETERLGSNPGEDARARADEATRGASSAAARRGTYPGAPAVSRPGAALTHAYDALLRALHVSGRGEEVESAFAQMTDCGARRTVHTYNSLIASHEARRQWQRAGDAMARMQEEGIAPDAITFDALIDVAEETGQWDRATAWLEQAQEEGHLRCEDELGVLDLHRIRSAGTAQTVLRWWLRRMRARALAPLDAAAAGRGTRAILEKTAGVAKGQNGVPAQIRDLPEQIQVVTGWGKHSTVFGHSPVKERVLALLGGLNSPFDVPDHNIGCVVADRGDVRAWLVRDELLSLVRFLGGNKDALKRNFNPKSAGIKR
jgi:pentatricopeptide repeat protein